ncbi:MAG: type II toxin-antitoxin system RelE/ParE family toxin [Chloroflexi bacterium]|nr:type II toxin-antitoxin system RelE/ParE family toxin [Chloroflexota bacterium]
MTVEWGTRALRDMRRLAARDRERINAKIEQYAANPASLARQVVAVTGGPYRRLRVGDYRVIFDVERGDPVVLAVVRVRHRREAYD